MEYIDLNTSSIEIISSLHGKQRRIERDINKKDLQAAIKYGVVEKQRNNRYKITYNNIIYITDETMTKEVTSFSAIQLPLEHVPYDARQIDEQKRRIKSELVSITSHTVLIIDQSTSMNNGDVMGHRSRSRSVYYQIANEMIAIPLKYEQLSFTDVITIIEMRENAIVNNSIYMEPCTWQLHNKLVDLANDPLRGRGHGNYYPSLVEAFKILKLTDNQNSALMLLILSDGRPSDAASYFAYVGRSLAGTYASEQILNVVRQICSTFRERLTFGAFGFAFDSGDLFRFMKTMTETAKSAGSSAIFSSGIDTESLRKALHLMSTSLVSTKSNLSSIVQGSQKSKIRTELMEDASKRSEGSEGSDIIFDTSDYNFYTEDVFRYSYLKHDDTDGFFEVPLQHPHAKGFAVRKEYFGSGVERLVFDCTEVDSAGTPVGRPLVAKLSMYHENEDQFEFHKASGRTQIQAFRLARKFNEFLGTKSLQIPNICFLEVSSYTIQNEILGYTFAFLVERRLDRNRYKKYNDNTGGVKDINKENGVVSHHQADLQTIVEEDEEHEELTDTNLSPALQLEAARIIDDDIPQAFSHWSYQYTKGEMLICDLQGTLGKDFYLTDPAINSSKRGRFGSTDLGKLGQKTFFDSHVCNSLCHVLRLRPTKLNY